jgi:hypothetical protein
MLKQIGIILMALTIVGFNGNAQAHKPEQGQGDQQQSARIPEAQIKQGEPSTPQPKSEQHVLADVQVIRAPNKDSYDIAAFWLSTILAGIGIAGVIVGIITLRYLRKQAGEMQLQRKVMVRSLRAMRQQGERENKTLILQYRPKIMVRNAKALQFSFELGKPWECEVRFQVVNTGGSPAHVMAGSHIQLAAAVGHDIGKIEIKWGEELQISSVTLGPGQAMTVDECLPTGAQFDIQWENFNQGLETQPHRYLYLAGIIYYEDDLDIQRSTGIYRGFDPKTREFTPKRETEQEYSD